MPRKTPARARDAKSLTYVDREERLRSSVGPSSVCDSTRRIRQHRQQLVRTRIARLRS